MKEAYELYRSTGEGGEYVIEKSGYHPQAGDAFLYSDKKYQFWFYVEFLSETNNKNYRLRIKEVSTERFAGGLPVVSIQDREVIKKNILSYFSAFDISGCEITESNPAPIVEFTWMFAHDNIR